MEQLKNSEQTLRFLNDLAKFSETFQTHNPDSSCAQEKREEKKENKRENNGTNKESESSPTFGIADDFIQNILDSYLNKQK